MQHQSLWKFLDDLERSPANIADVDEIRKLVEGSSTRALQEASNAYQCLQPQKLRSVLYVLKNDFRVSHKDIVQYLREESQYP